MVIETNMKIAVIDDDPTRFLVVEEGLREAGYTNVIHIKERVGLLQAVNSLQPDVIIIDLGNPNRDVLEQAFHMSRIVPRPVVMFVDEADVDTISTAVEAGVSAYIVDGLKKERVKGILQEAVLRFRAFAAMKGEIASLRTQLEERKIIERAKGVIMEAKGLSEDEAYQMLKTQSMATNRRIIEIATAIVMTTDLLK
jgi:two-component system, response regulator / RNA-binding antiterminator